MCLPRPGPQGGGSPELERAVFAASDHARGRRQRGGGVVQLEPRGTRRGASKAKKYDEQEARIEPATSKHALSILGRLSSRPKVEPLQEIAKRKVGWLGRKKNVYCLPRRPQIIN